MKELVNYWGFKLAFLLLLVLGSVSFALYVYPRMIENIGIIPAIILLGVVSTLYGKLGRIAYESIIERYNKE